MVRPRPVRRFLQGRRGIVESYQVGWHGRGVFQERLCVRVDRYRDRYEITGEVLAMDDRSDWQPVHMCSRPLTPAEWEQVRQWLEAGFWRQPGRVASAPVMDGECWDLRGYRDGAYHEVYRDTGSLLDGGGGAEVFALGRRLAALAGLTRFEEMPER